MSQATSQTKGPRFGFRTLIGLCAVLRTGALGHEFSGFNLSCVFVVVLTFALTPLAGWPNHSWLGAEGTKDLGSTDFAEWHKMPRLQLARRTSRLLRIAVSSSPGTSKLGELL